MRKTLVLIVLASAFYFFPHIQLPAVDAADSSPDEAFAVRTSAATGTGALTRHNFEDVVQRLYDHIGLVSYDLSFDVFRLGMIGYFSLEREGALNDKGLITIIDFEKPSTEKRFYTIDLINKEVRYHTYVAHGRNTGENIATHFSNIPNSNQSSLGFYVTGETYVGSKGYSLRLDGMEKSFNSMIRSRAVVIHAADYATEKWISRYGRLGRSQGCPALPPHLNKEVINTIKDKTVIFTYYPNRDYLTASRYLQVERLFQKLDESPRERTAITVKRSRKSIAT